MGENVPVFLAEKKEEKLIQEDRLKVHLNVAFVKCAYAKFV